MLRKNFGLADLGLLNGGMYGAAFRRHLRAAVADCEDRPNEKKKRVVTLKIELTPQTLQDGALTDAELLVHVGSSIPKHVGVPVSCRIPKHVGDLAYNDLSESNPDQRTIDEAAEID